MSSRGPTCRFRTRRGPASGGRQLLAVELEGVVDIALSAVHLTADDHARVAEARSCGGQVHGLRLARRRTHRQAGRLHLPEEEGGEGIREDGQRISHGGLPSRSASDAGRERQGVHKGTVVLAVAPLQLEIRLAYRCPDRPLVACQRLRRPRRHCDVPDKIDTCRTAGEIFTLWSSRPCAAMSRGSTVRFILAARLASASSFVFSVSIRSMATSVGSRSMQTATVRITSGV